MYDMDEIKCGKLKVTQGSMVDADNSGRGASPFPKLKRGLPMVDEHG
jgi:hypothetical protein